MVDVTYDVILPGRERADEVIAMDFEGWYAEPDPGVAEQAREWVDWDRMYAAALRGDQPVGADGRIVGLLGAYAGPLTAPGAGDTVVGVDALNLSWASVHSDVRRRGVLSALMQAQFDRAKADGVAVLTLFASEPGIYGRFGYGTASLMGRVTFGSGTEFTVPSSVAARADEIATRLVELASEEGRDAYVAALALASRTSLGVVRLPEAVQRASAVDVPARRRDRETDKILVAVGGDGAVQGMAVLSRRAKWDDGMPGGTVGVDAFYAVDDGVALALLRRLTSFDLMKEVKFYQAPEDCPWVWWAGGPRAVGMPKYGDALWVRLADVGTAMTQRGYAVGAAWEGVVEVLDEKIPANAGLWQVRIAEDGSGVWTKIGDAAAGGADSTAAAATASATADVTVPVAALGAAYLGQFTWLDLARRYEIAERTPGTLAALNAAMWRHDRAVTPTEF